MADICNHVQIGIDKIHSLIKENNPPLICKHCCEVADDLPINYKLKG